MNFHLRPAIKERRVIITFRLCVTLMSLAAESTLVLIPDILPFPTLLSVVFFHGCTSLYVKMMQSKKMKKKQAQRLAPAYRRSGIKVLSRYQEAQFSYRMAKTLFITSIVLVWREKMYVEKS